MLHLPGTERVLALNVFGENAWGELLEDAQLQGARVQLEAAVVGGEVQCSGRGEHGQRVLENAQVVPLDVKRSAHAFACGKGGRVEEDEVPGFWASGCLGSQASASARTSACAGAWREFKAKLRSRPAEGGVGEVDAGACFWRLPPRHIR